MSTVNYQEIQQKTYCNWCRNVMVMSEPISEANFVDTGKQYPALYCSRCLADDFRKSQPKMGINVETLDEINLEDLPDNSNVSQQPKPKPEQPAEETPAAAQP